MENRTQDADGIVFQPESGMNVLGHMFTGLGILFFTVLLVAMVQEALKNSLVAMAGFLSFFGVLFGASMLFWAVAGWSYRMAHSAIVFDAAGLRVLNDGRTRYRFLPWSQFPYGYFRKNMKGFRFVVLSSTPLTSAKVKRAGNLDLRIYHEDYIVFPFKSITTSLEQDATIQEMICENVPNITGEF